MNDSSLLDHNLNELKNLTIPTLDVRDRVMTRINELKQVKKLNRTKKNISLAAASITAICIAIPVSATVLPITWNGMNFSIQQDGGTNSKIESLKELIAGHEDARQWLDRGIRLADQTFTFDQSKSTFPFPILQAHTSTMPLVRSIGLKTAVTVNGKKSLDQFSYSYWDEYNKGSEWVVVSQVLDEAGTAYMNHTSQSYSATYVDGYKQIKIDEKSIGFIVRESHNEYLMFVKYWVADDQKMIELQISGNVTEETMVTVAKSYIPQ